MNFARSLVLVVLLSLAAGAQPEPVGVKAYEDFEAGFEGAMTYGDYARAAGWVRLNADAARVYWTHFKDAELAKPSRLPAFKLLRDRYSSVLAQELARKGDAKALSEAKRLSWYMSDMVDYRPRPKLVMDLPDYAACQRVLMWQARTMELAAGLDETRVLQSCVNNIVQIAAHQDAERQALKLVDIDNPARVIAPLARRMPTLVELNRGNSLAISEDKVFELARLADPGGISEEELMYFRALRRNARPGRLESALKRGRTLGWVRPGGLRDYVYTTYEMSLRAERDPHLKPEDVLAAHQRTLAILEKHPNTADQPLLGQEIAIWIDLLLHWNDHPKFGQLMRNDLLRYGSLLPAMVRPAREREGIAWLDQGRVYCDDLAYRNMLMDLFQAFQEVGQGWRAKALLEKTFPDRAKYRDQSLAGLAALEAAIQGDFPARDAALLESEGLKLETLRPHLQEGGLARLLERWCVLEMTFNEVNPQLPALFEESERWGQMARRHLGWLGWNDGRWWYVTYLFRNQPSDWRAQAARVILSLEQDCNRLDFQLGQATLLYRGATLERANQPQLALEKLNRAVALMEAYLNELGANSEAREQFRITTKAVYAALTELQIQLGKPDQALQTLLRQQQVETVSRNSALMTENSKAAPLFKVRGQTQELQAAYQANVVAGRDNTQTQKLLANSKAQFHTVLGDLRSKYPNYESALAIRPVNFSQSQKYLPAGAAILQYFPTAEKLFIFVVTRDKLVIREVSVTEKQLAGRVAHLQQEMLKPTRVPHGPYSWTGQDHYLDELRQDLTSLYQMLIAPVEGDLAEAKVLAFVPTGRLHYVPFAALARPQGEGLEFLVERYPCVNLVKSSDLENIGHPPTAGNGGLLAFANPDGSLPGAEREVKGISGLFQHAQQYLGKDFTAARLKQIDSKARYLHLATHGILDPRDPKQSYLLLAGQEGSNHLTLADIYGLSLDGLRLVTLSACETGRESEQPGSELSSLADAFSVAGSNSVVATLWSVSDEATEKLMVEFYKSLQHQRSLADSLQQAELALLKDPATAHPFFWAPFLILGDWR